jgi:ubiquinone/menaquinone biosynthesis C-methylase UbiE
MPYEDGYFDLIHARAVHTGIRDYPRFLGQVARILRPGGLVILIEPDLRQFVRHLPRISKLEVAKNFYRRTANPKLNIRLALVPVDGSRCGRPTGAASSRSRST